MPTLPIVRVRNWFAVLLLLWWLPALPAQQIIGLLKVQAFMQTSATAVNPVGSGPYQLRFRTDTGLAVTPPGMPLVNITATQQFDGDLRAFATKSELDTAFPNGTYRINAPGATGLTLNLGPDAYAANTPQVISATNATWSNGVLVVTNRTQPVTLNLSTFTEYAGGGAAGYFGLDVSGVGNPFDQQQDAVSRPILGLPVQATVPTSYTIPANQLNAAGIYTVHLNFWTLQTVDTSSLNGLLFSGFGKNVVFYLVVPGATTLPVPAIVNQPASLTRNLGGTATFAISTNPGLQGAFIRWMKNGEEINTVAPKYSIPLDRLQLTINNLTAEDAGFYTVHVVSPAGLAVSQAAVLTVALPPPPAPPVIVAQPASHTVAPGNTVVFSVEATGNPAPTYQWRRGTTVLPTETRPTLVLNGPGVTAGTYSCVVTNSLGSATSADATLTVSNVQATNVGRLINLSVLAPTGPGDQLLTMGATVGGQGAAGSLPLVIRGIGPTLGSFGVGGVLADPVLSILTAGSSTPSATNDNWGGTPALVSAFASVGAFALPAASLDSAALLNQTAGGIVVQVAGKGTASGTVIAEVYDAAGSARGATTPRLTNLSTLTSIAPGDTLSAGFVIGGTTSRTVLVRAVGPTLGTAFGIGGAMADPKLEFFNNATSTKIAENDNWGGPSWLLAANGAVGAFALSGPNSRDAALLITLAPGQYSARVSGVGGTGGTAIIEVYEVP